MQVQDPVIRIHCNVQFLTCVTRPAATVIPPTLSMNRPSSLMSLYSSIQMGCDVSSSTTAFELHTRHRGRHLTTSPELLCNWATSLVITACSSNDWWWRITCIAHTNTMNITLYPTGSGSESACISGLKFQFVLVTWLFCFQDRLCWIYTDKLYKKKINASDQHYQHQLLKQQKNVITKQRNKCKLLKKISWKQWKNILSLKWKKQIKIIQKPIGNFSTIWTN